MFRNFPKTADTISILRLEFDSLLVFIMVTISKFSIDPKLKICFPWIIIVLFSNWKLGFMVEFDFLYLLLVVMGKISFSIGFWPHVFSYYDIYVAVVSIVISHLWLFAALLLIWTFEVLHWTCEIVNQLLNFLSIVHIENVDFCYWKLV
jgi:hypothetical protein